MTYNNFVRSLFFFLAAMLGGCEGCHSHDHPHGEHEDGHAAQHEGPHDDHSEAEESSGAHAHDHSEGATSITRWTDKLELFAEYPPAVAGQELSFLAHLTVLDGFRALEKAEVTLVLDGPTRVEGRAAEMLRPGIFQPKLKAPRAGTYKCRLEVTGPEVQDVIEGFEIVVHESAGAAQKARADDKVPTGASPIAFSKEQQWKIPFATAFATRDTVVPTIEVAGEVSTPPSGQADVGAATSGRLVAPQNGLPRPGQSVKRGELLATIAPAPSAPEDAARAELAVVEAKSRKQAAEAAVARAERLIEDAAISQREVDDAKRELEVSEQAIHAAERARAVFSGSASGTGPGSYRVTSPIDGVVVEVSVTTGQSVQGGEPLFRVVNMNELWIVARVPEQQAALIRADKDAGYQLPGLPTWLPLSITGDDAMASVINVGRTVDRLSRTVEVIYALKNPDERLRVGALLRVAVPAGEPFSGVVVPRGAVLDDEGRSVVYVQREGEAFDERSVRLGPSSGALVGIESGVQPGERVVTLGANVVRLSARAGASPSHGHVH